MTERFERERRWRRATGLAAVALLLMLDVVATGLLGGGERFLAIVRSIVLPGLAFLEWLPWLGVATIAAFLAALGAWLRWGVDWAPVFVLVASVSGAVFVMPLHHHEPEVHAQPHTHGTTLLLRAARSIDVTSHEVVRASHEFTIVLVVFALVARLRLLAARLPGAEWLRGWLPAEWRYPAVTIARSCGLALLVRPGDPAALRALEDSRLLARARRIDRWARWRATDQRLSGAHAALRAALACSGHFSQEQSAALIADARSSIAGVPCSEPTWVRPLDGMLAAFALRSLGETETVERWRATFGRSFALAHGRRPAALHVPSVLAIGTLAGWEHAAASVLAYRLAWVDDADWRALRPRCLGTAASGARDADALRFVAAGFAWARCLNDVEALEILGRRSIEGDALAVALRQLGDLPCGADGRSRPTDSAMQATRAMSRL